MNTSTQAVMFGKASDEWRTPREVFDALNREFAFTTDVACRPSNSLCAHSIFSALDTDWSDDGDYSRAVCFMNPPYSKCRAFIAKAAVEASKGATVVALVPSRTDTRWWHRHVWDRDQDGPRDGVEVRFIPGRLKFLGPDGEPLRDKHGRPVGAPFPSVVIVFRGQR